MNFTEKEKRVLKEVNLRLPGVKVVPMARSGNREEVRDSHYCIPPENQSLASSQYCYKGELSFIHFSSLFAIQSIISEGKLRLYNLNNLNDPREYSFAGDLLTFNRANREDAKKNFFLLSMCRKKILTGNTGNEFNMWRLYGNNGFGVAIELDFAANRPGDWCDFFLSPVAYGTKTKTKLKELSTLILKLKDEKPSLDVDLGQVVCFHKSQLYHLEDEIRLLYDTREKRLAGATKYWNDETNYNFPLIKTDISKSNDKNKLIRYLELPIYSEKNNTCHNTKVPLPKIKKIIFGYQNKKLNGLIIKEIIKLSKENLGYVPKIELSRLSRYYHETD